MVELRVAGIRVELPMNTPVLLLKETDGPRYLPIWIGSVEAAAIANEQQGVHPDRPMTHDLLRDVIAALGATVERVVITEMATVTESGGQIYVAELVLRAAGSEEDIRISARPSDGVALALRAEAPIYAEDAIVEEVGVEIPEEQEDEVEKFREFLDTISPDDFAGS
ncbi:MAG: bifunctional nuclease family protein [Mycobacteriales bacterium]